MDFAPSVGEISRRINFSTNSTSIAARFSFSPDDLEAEQKIDSIIETGKIRRWAQLGAIPTAQEAPVAQNNIPVAKSIRIKGADGVSSDSSSHQKTAVTNFSFTRAMALTNQLKLMTGNGDNRGGAAARSTGTVFGGGPNSTAPSLSQNLRTMVAFNSLRTDGNNASTTHRESTEDSGIDQSSNSGGSTVPQGPTVNALQSNAPSMVIASAPTSVAASSSDPDNGADEVVDQKAV